MDVARQFTNRCACGWEFRGSRDAVVDATIDHGRRLHNMEASREEVIAAIAADGSSPGGANTPDGPTEATAG